MSSSFSDLIKNISSTTTPAELDPEDSYHSIDSKPLKHQSHLQYQSVSPSKLRNQFEFELEDHSTNKYSGRKVSRKDIEGAESDEEIIDGEGDSDGSNEEEEDEEDDDDEEEDEEISSNPNPDLLKFKPHPQLSSSSSKPKPEEEDSSIPENNLLVKQLQASVKADILKGKAIRSQLVIYDTLLGLRIGLQKILTTTNEISQKIGKESIPDPDQTVLRQLTSLSSSVGNLRSEMMKKNDLLEIPDQETKKRKPESDLQSCINESRSLDSILSPFLRSTISKWSTKIHSASSLSSQGKKFNAVNQNVMNQIDSLWKMPGEKERLIERSRLKRHKANEKQKLNEGVEQMDIFDDRDFYVSLLKEVVDTNLKETDPSNYPSNRSQRTHKTGVDPKASKGRKIRYNVHEKIVSFMVPITMDLWTEEAKDELFGSLLGRGFEESQVMVEKVEGDGKEVGLGGLKLF